MQKDLVILFFPKTKPDNVLPIALLKLASQITAKGYKVKIIDSRLDTDYRTTIERLIKDALCVGISSMTGYTIEHSLKASRIVKELDKKVPVIWGGWHCSMLPGQTLQNEFVDIVVRGQGEAAIVEILDALRSGQGLQGIRGISYKDAKGGIIHNEDRPFQDIKDFEPVNFDLLDISKYITATPLGSRTIFWNTSQGCPYHCGFCSTPILYKSRWSSLSVERILKEIEILMERFDINGLVFAEDNFLADPNRVRKLCEGLIEKKLDIRWSTDARIDSVIKLSDEFLSLLKKSGCVKLYLGAESGDQEILDLIDKYTRVEDTVAAAEKLHRHGIIAELFLMVGFPLDPDRDLDMTLKLIREIKEKYPNHQATPFIYTPYPGTKLFNLSVEKGLKAPQRLEDWINWTMLTITTPWVDRAYLNKVNSLIKFYLPFAYPSDSLLRTMRTFWPGIFYRVMHRIAHFRVKRNFFFLPAEWQVVKYLYYNFKIEHNLFKNMPVPR
jgi:radical SAM superfamily enzyme YgiQ (UPF0313 family)